MLKYYAYFLKIFIKCVESHKNSEIVDFKKLVIISCFFPYRVGTYRQELCLFITVCRKLKTKYMATNNMGTFYTITIG